MNTLDWRRREFPSLISTRRFLCTVEYIKDEAKATSDFAYAASLTEAMLLGLVSLRADQQKIRWDAEAGKVTNVPAANQYLARQRPREPGSLQGAQETVQTPTQ